MKYTPKCIKCGWPVMEIVEDTLTHSKYKCDKCKNVFEIIDYGRYDV